MAVALATSSCAVASAGSDTTPFTLKGCNDYAQLEGFWMEARNVVLPHSLVGARVDLSVRRLRDSRHYRSLGSAVVRRGGVIRKRFRIPRRPGTYRLRWSYAGSSTVAPGRFYENLLVAAGVS